MKLNPKIQKLTSYMYVIKKARRTEIPYEEKAQGDAYLKEKNYDQAMRSYSKALMAFKILAREDGALNEEQIELMMSDVVVA